MENTENSLFTRKPCNNGKGIVLAVAALLMGSVLCLVRPVPVLADATRITTNVCTSDLNPNSNIHIAADIVLTIDESVSLYRISIGTNCTLTIKGVPGKTLTITNGIHNESYEYNSYSGSNLTVESGHIVCGGQGIHVFDLNIINGTVESKKYNGSAITVENSITISGGTVTARAYEAGQYGIDAARIDDTYPRHVVKISGGKVTASGSVHGIWGDQIIIEGNNTYVWAENETDVYSAITARFGLTIVPPLTIIKPEDGYIVDDESIVNPDGVAANEVEIRQPSITVKDDGNGTGKADLSGASAGKTITLSATPVNGYVFDKWTTESAITFADKNNADTTFIMINKDVTVKANFKPIEKCTITFDKNGGSGTMTPQEVNKEAATKLNKNTFTREGYEFTNWNTAPDGKGDTYKDEDIITVNNDITLYAQWKANEAEKYTVTVTVDPAKSGTAKSSVKSGVSGKKVTLTAEPKAGYKFNKWKVVSGGVQLANVNKAKTTFKIKNANVKVKAIFEKIYKEPLPKLESKDDDKIILAWWKVNEAQGYDIFMSRCNHDGKEITPKKIKTIKENKTHKWTVTGLEPNRSYKAYIKAYTTNKNGKKKYISKSPLMHVYTAGGTNTLTNAKSVKLDTSDGKIKKGNKLSLNDKDTYKIKASVRKADKNRKLMGDKHVKKLRYRSSDPGIATVSASGKITARKPGKCKIYVYAHNGVNKTINLTVK